MTGRSSGVLLRHMLQQKLLRQRQIAAVQRIASAAQQPDRQPEEENESFRMTETRIYVGLNDGETRRQEYETGHYLGILKEICRSCHVAFSVDVEEGGYYHEDGEYTEETSLVLVLIEADPDVVQKIANELCVRFHQESVLVTVNQIDGRFISAEA